MNKPQQTSVRVVLNTDFTVQANRKGLTFGHSVITWGWIEDAKEAIFGKEKAAAQTSAPKTKRASSKKSAKRLDVSED